MEFFDIYKKKYGWMLVGRYYKNGSSIAMKFDTEVEHNCKEHIAY